LTSNIPKTVKESGAQPFVTTFGGVPPREFETQKHSIVASKTISIKNNPNTNNNNNIFSIAELNISDDILTDASRRINDRHMQSNKSPLNQNEINPKNNRKST